MSRVGIVSYPEVGLEPLFYEEHMCRLGKQDVKWYEDVCGNIQKEGKKKLNSPLKSSSEMWIH